MAFGSKKSGALGTAAGLAIGLGLQLSPPVFIDGTPPENAPDGGCYVVKSGILKGQSVCDLNAFGGDVEGAWTCTQPSADGGCDVFDFVATAGGDR